MRQNLWPNALAKLCGAALEDSQRRKELLAAIMTLPPKQARRIYARFYLGLDVVEIARKEGVAPANVYASIQHGLSKLRNKIKK